MSRRWPPPTYDMTGEEGLPHERQFTIACVVFKYREIGSGKSKKLAKRQAAHKMWERLQDTPLDPSQMVFEDEVSSWLLCKCIDFVNKVEWGTIIIFACFPVT